MSTIRCVTLFRVPELNAPSIASRPFLRERVDAINVTALVNLTIGLRQGSIEH